MDVLGIGVATRDIAVGLDSFPEPDSKLRARSLTEAGGGPVPTALVTLSRLGNRVAFAGIVGDDASGRSIAEGLSRERVDVGGVVFRRGLDCPTSVVLVEGGRRTILEWSQAELLLRFEELEARRVAFERCKFFLIDARLVDVQAEAARRVRASGGRVVLDCGHPRPGVEELLRVTDVAILSHTYAESVHGPDYDPRTFLLELSRRLPGDGPRIAGLTLGEQGCAIYSPQEGFANIAGHCVEALDSTGAGDVFHGAFVHASLRGESVVEAARFANAAAALKCRGMTGRARLPPEAVIRDLARTHP